MRLIDLNDDRHTYCDDIGEYELWSIDPDVPAVDAIPIEFIQKEIEKWDSYGSEKKANHAMGLRHLIEDWRYDETSG